MFLSVENKLDLFLGVLSQSKYGSIKVLKNNVCIFSHKGCVAGPAAEIKILNEEAPEWDLPLLPEEEYILNEIEEEEKEQTELKKVKKFKHKFKKP